MISMIRSGFVLSFILTLILIAVIPRDSAAQTTSGAESPALIGVKMDAEWCPKCKVMNPKLEEVMPEFQGEDILFLKFNMTDDFTIYQTSLLAKRLGLTELFEQHKGQTGYMVIVDAHTHEVIKRLNSDLSEEELKTQIAELL
ncbi:MAG: thioredoxin family protein [Balneolaceae bacterium]